MSARSKVLQTQRALESVTAASAVLWAAGAALVLFVAVTVVTALIGMQSGGLARYAATVAAVAAASAALWRSRFVWMPGRVALWIEERAPELQYLLVTATEDRYAALLDPAALARIDAVRTGGFVRRAALRSLWVPLVVALAGAALLLALPSALPRVLERQSHATFANATRAALLAGSRLTPLTVRVIPPPYAHLESEDIDEPTTVSALQGSSIVISGPGGRSDVSASVSYAGGRSTALRVAERNDGWTAAMTFGDTVPALVQLTDRAYTRAIVVSPRADAPPRVELRLPARDTVLRSASGALDLSADVSDEIGIAAAEFEYIISSGSEETFTFRQGRLGGRQFRGEKKASLAASIPYSFFKLGEGDRVSIRAVATDFNSVSGPGKGFSETRTIRIARKDEYDSLAVEAAAPSGDTAMMSLRMLIVETEKLAAARAKLAQATLVSRARALARETDNVRAAVLPLEKEEGTSAPEVTMDTEPSNEGLRVNAQVRGALNDLEEASRRLDIAEPQTALPPMYRAYKALQAFRSFKRYYFRGAARPVIVDIQRVRLTGKTKGSATAMSARPAAASDRDRLRTEYSAAVEQLVRDPKKAVMALTAVRVESLKKYPALSAAVEEALIAIEKGRDATPALVRARRLLEGAPRTTTSIPLWSGGW